MSQTIPKPPRQHTPTGHHPAAYRVVVRDERTKALAGSDGHTYTSPPQTELQARALLALLAETPLHGFGPWRHAIAGGQRTIHLQPLTP